MNPATAQCVGTRRHTLYPYRLTPWAGCSDSLRNRLICRVVAPPEAPGRQPVVVPQPQPPATLSGDFWSSTTSFASQLLSHFRVPAFAAASPDAVLRAASTKERELQNAKAPVDVSAFLSPVGVWELKHIRKLSHLTSLTYYMHLVTPRRLRRTHALELVTTSRACEIMPYEHNKTAAEVAADGDGMAVSIQEAREAYQALKRDGGGTAAAGAGQGLAMGMGGAGSSNIVTLSRDTPYQVVLPAATGAAPPPLLAGAPTGAGQAAAAVVPPLPLRQQQPGCGGSSGPQLPSLTAPTALPRMLRSPAEVVAAMLADAAQAATSAAATAATAASPLASAAAESLYAGLASLPIGNALAAANNRASNALLSAPSQGSAAVVSTASTATSSADGAAATIPAATAGDALDGAAGSYPALGNGRRATAASIAALATDQIRQQSIRAMIGFGAGRSSGGGGLATMNASGLLQPPPPPAATTAVTSADGGGAAAAGITTPSSSSLDSAAFTCPSEWFVVDELATNTRIFVIQGSDTLDHWKLNLTFDPVTFEEPSLGVKVHRGVYEAALVLYERFLPLVYEHLESSPFSKVAFTGHSIGGSLATLLMLMYRSRGVLPPHSIGTVYTFGAPAVFCQTHSHSHSHQAHQAHRGGGAATVSPAPPPPGTSNSWISLSESSSGASVDSSRSSSSGSSISLSSVEDVPLAGPSLRASPSAAAATASTSIEFTTRVSGGSSSNGCGCGADLVLSRLHLPPSIVRNVIMARDIVPRAFACDYSPVADILKGWGSSFKDHCCLNRHGRKHLYYFIGRMCILQPDSWHSFTANDPDHPMLPPGPEIFALIDSQLPRSPATVAAVPPPPPSRPAARSVTEAVWELMDCPHPLETLADPGAYLASGSISRYHNPENYTKALGRIVHLKRRAERRSAQRPPPPPLRDVAEEAETVAVPWDSSDGLDLDLRLGSRAVSLAAVDAHA